MSDELRSLAEILDNWIAPAPGIPAIYLFAQREVFPTPRNGEQTT